MPRIKRDSSTGRFTVRSEGDGKRATIQEGRSGAVLDLKGYGALKGEFTVRRGINLSKPIAAQAAKAIEVKRAKASGNEAAKRR